MRVRGLRNAEFTLAAALPWLGEKAASKGPFFLFFHLFDPHYPYDPPEEYAVRFLPQGRSESRTVVDRRPPGPKSEWNLAESEYQEFVSRYDGEIAYADHHLGLLMDELGRLGVVDDTLVVFTSDHGETLHEREWVFDHGGRAYDEQIRVPLVIRLPGGRHAGRRVASQVGHVDYLATILEILDIPAPDVAGRSVVGLLEQGIEDDRSRPAFAHARHVRERVPETGALLRGDGFISVIRLPTLKLIEYPIAGGRWFSQLFDLRSDPGETRNLAAERVEVVDRLHEALDRWRISTGGYEIIPPQPLRPDVEETLRALGYIE
jgi:arylsulfatase A-like enzyme